MHVSSEKKLSPSPLDDAIDFSSLNLTSGGDNRLMMAEQDDQTFLSSHPSGLENDQTLTGDGASTLQGNKPPCNKGGRMYGVYHLRGSMPKSSLQVRLHSMVILMPSRSIDICSLLASLWATQEQDEPSSGYVMRVITYVIDRPLSDVTKDLLGLTSSSSSSSSSLRSLDSSNEEDIMKERPEDDSPASFFSDMLSSMLWRAYVMLDGLQYDPVRTVNIPDGTSRIFEGFMGPPSDNNIDPYSQGKDEEGQGPYLRREAETDMIFDAPESHSVAHIPVLNEASPPSPDDQQASGTLVVRGVIAIVMGCAIVGIAVMALSVMAILHRRRWQRSQEMEFLTTRAPLLVTGQGEEFAMI